MTTIREWGTKLVVQGCIKRVGRPTKLTPVEDVALEQFFSKVREEGGLIDREGIVVMAHEVIRKNRPELTIEEVPTFGDSHARDYKRRKGWSFRAGTTDRRPSTILDILQDSEWRRLVLDVFENPRKHSISMPENLQSIPTCLRLAADETPVHFLFRWIFLWKGSTERCHLKTGDTLKPHVSPLMYHDHAKKKTQNHATFFLACG